MNRRCGINWGPGTKWSLFRAGFQQSKARSFVASKYRTAQENVGGAFLTDEIDGRGPVKALPTHGLAVQAGGINDQLKLQRSSGEAQARDPICGFRF
jgi:hypothetical protein